MGLANKPLHWRGTSLRLISATKLCCWLSRMNEMTRPPFLEENQEPWCMFCGAHAGERSDAGENSGVNRATAVYYCTTCDYMYCSICSYKNDSCAEDEAVCVRCDNIMKGISQQ